MYSFLSGVRVLDLSEEPAGAYASRLLAHYGAQVIKVEPPAGDPLRAWGPFPDDRPDPEKSGLFLYLNADKRGITLNIDESDGRDLLLRLAGGVDAVIRSYRPGASSTGVTEEELLSAAPRLAITTVSPFGKGGPYADYKGSDLIAWAASSALAFTGQAEREPLIIGTGLSYYATGTLAAIATLGALFKDETRQSADVGLLDGMVQLYGSSPINRGKLMFDMPRGVARDPISGPHLCKNGYVGINPLSPQHWPMFCAMAGLTELVDDPRFNTSPGRARNAAELEAYIGPWFMERTKEEIFEMSLAYSLPTAFVTTAPDILALEQHEAREFLEDLPIPGHAPIRMPSRPVHFPQMKPSRSSPAPRLGEHNEEVYSSLGLTPSDLRELRNKGLVS